MQNLTRPIATATALGLMVTLVPHLGAQSTLRLASHEESSELTEFEPARSQSLRPYTPREAYTPNQARTPAISRSVPTRRPVGFPGTTRQAVPTTTANSQVRSLPGNVRNVIGYFGSQQAAHTLQQMPQRPRMSARISPPTAATQPSQPKNKPFDHATNGTTVSPYLNLHRDEDLDSAPNYYAFVRPQLQQQEANQQQQSNIQQLNRQVQRISYGTSAAGASTGAAAPATGHGARFGDTAQYYRGFDR